MNWHVPIVLIVDLGLCTFPRRTDPTQNAFVAAKTVTQVISQRCFAFSSILNLTSSLISHCFAINTNQQNN
jgi:hypothetical protein